MLLEFPQVSMCFHVFSTCLLHLRARSRGNGETPWGPNQSHVQRQEGRDVLPAAVGHEASGPSDIVLDKMPHTPIAYMYIVYVVPLYNVPMIPML